jgi:GNAT superfamily N-acetyltransferase
MWFQRHAWSNHLRGASRVTVLQDALTGRIAGYVTLSAAQIERAFLPKPQRRNRPDPVPVTLLGQLAVDKQYQGQGHAKSLLLFALRTALQASAVIGSTGVITHPLDDGMRGFYSRWGFQDLPFDPRRAMIVRMADLRASFTGPDE